MNGWTISWNHAKRAWAIYPEITDKSEIMNSDKVIWRKRKDAALKVLEQKMKEMKR